MEYGQFCPVAKASEILGEKWTILIMRELLMGSTRFSELQRGLGFISPTILTKRLAMLDEQGLVLRKRISGRRGFEYLPTQSCKELLPIILSIGEWGMRWTSSNLTESDYDVRLLMTYLERSIEPDKLPGKETVIHFQFTDLADLPHWWIVVSDTNADVCTSDPGKDVDIYFSTSVKVMADVWMGFTTYRKVISDDLLVVTGPRALTKDISSWMGSCIFTNLPAASEIMN